MGKEPLGQVGIVGRVRPYLEMLCPGTSTLTAPCPEVLLPTLPIHPKHAGYTGVIGRGSVCQLWNTWPHGNNVFFVFFTDIVNCDLKSTLRVLYNLFTKYRNVE